MNYVATTVIKLSDNKMRLFNKNLQAQNRDTAIAGAKAFGVDKQHEYEGSSLVGNFLFPKSEREYADTSDEGFPSEWLE